MYQKLVLTKLKIAVSAKAIIAILARPLYSVLAVVIAFLFLQLFYWLLNYQLLWFFLTTSSISFFGKIDTITSISFQYIAGLPLWQSVLLVLLAIVQGIVISAIIYNIKVQRTLDTASASGSLIASIIAAFSVGCISCGTSIIAPVLGIFFSSVTVSMGEAINKISVIISFIIALYALYAIGKTSANVRAKASINKS